MTYRPRYKAQAGTGTCQWTNCNPTSHKMAVDRATRGNKNASVIDIRNKIHLYCPGTTLEQNHDAVRSLYDVHMDVTYQGEWDAFVSGIVSGRGAVVRILYYTLHGTPYDASRSFDGGHAVFVNERRHNSNLDRYDFLVYDPLADKRYPWIPQGPQWWPASLLRRAMEAGAMEFSFTKNTEWLERTVACTSAHLRKGPSAKYDLIENNLPKGTVLYTSRDKISGGNWSFDCGGSKSGNTWYKVTAVDGKSTIAKYGIKTLYVATGWV